MDKKAIRDSIRLLGGVICCPLYIPHCFAMIAKRRTKKLIISDLKAIEHQLNIKIPIWLQWVYQIHNNSYFRSVFYHRVGPILTLLLGWYRPGNKYLMISNSTRTGEGMKFAHPYATIINAESIGDNFHFIHCTTLGATDKGRPIIGNNVTCGAGVIIIGNVSIGDNVTIGAGSVVVKDIPSNCIAVGNPARVIKYIE